MASLTDEQRRRIEENKRKALAIRAAKQSPASSNISSLQPVGASISSKPYTGLSSNFSNQSTSNVTNSSTSSNGTATNAQSATNSNPNSWKSGFKNYKTVQENKPVASLFYGSNFAAAGVTVHFSLISNVRFTVDFPFNDTIVKVLKTVPGKLYDPKRAKWNFPLSSYNECKTRLQDIKEFPVLIKPLPNYIIKVFIQQPRVNLDYKSIDLSRISSILISNLYPFQKEGVQFGISKNGRCIIADDMGLGKTIQALGIAHYYYSDWPLLIVCPSSMRYQWEEEIRNNIPDIPITRIFVHTKSKEQIHKPLVLITSYDLMARTGYQLKELKFGVIVMDESHSMKNLKANRTKIALELISQAKRCILLSGTPALSRPYELFPQIKALEPNAFSGKEFGVRYCDAKESRFGWDFTGSSNMDELRVLLEDRFMIRRLKSTVLDQLPRKIRQVVILDKESIKAGTKTMNDLALKLNDETLKGAERRGTLLSYFAETAKIKLQAINDYICQLIETGNKFLVFAHHKIVLDEICKLLEVKKTFYIRIDGSVSSDERKSVCDQFQLEDKFRVAVLSITAASTGITLTAANLVIFAELFWNPGILTQAEDRVHRIGQQDSVLVQYLLASGTADDYLWTMVKSKLETLNQAGLSKDSFSCERTTMTCAKDQKKIDDFFDDIQELEADLSQILDEVEESESKRIKLADESVA